MLKLYAKAALLLTIVAYLTDAKSLLEQKLGKYAFKLIFWRSSRKGFNEISYFQSEIIL